MKNCSTNIRWTFFMRIFWQSWKGRAFVCNLLLFLGLRRSTFGLDKNFWSGVNSLSNVGACGDCTEDSKFKLFYLVIVQVWPCDRKFNSIYQDPGFTKICHINKPLVSKVPRKNETLLSIKANSTPRRRPTRDLHLIMTTPQTQVYLLMMIPEVEVGMGNVLN